MKNVFDITPQQVQPQMKKRVAAYARVSSGKDAMLHSLKAQISSPIQFSIPHPVIVVSYHNII